MSAETLSKPAAKRLAKKAVNASVRADLLQDAKSFNINISQVLEMALASHVKRLKEEAWQAENKEAIEAYNAHIEKHGLWTESIRKRVWGSFKNKVETSV